VPAGVTRNLLLLAASLLVALVLAEAAARRLDLGPSRESPDVVLRLPLQHAGLDRSVSRAEIDPVHPSVRCAPTSAATSSRRARSRSPT